jgi:hypothetical protein
MLFGPHRGLLLALPAAVAALLLASACDSEEDQAERRQAVGTLVDAVALEPQPGETGIRISETRSEADAPYYTAGGTLPGDRAAVVTLLERTLRDQGWDVFESEAVDYSLGWLVRGAKGSMVAMALIGWHDAPKGEFNPRPRLPGRVWVAIAVGRKGSNQLWTQVD